MKGDRDGKSAKKVQQETYMNFAYMNFDKNKTNIESYPDAWLVGEAASLINTVISKLT